MTEMERRAFGPLIMDYFRWCREVLGKWIRGETRNYPPRPKSKRARRPVEKEEEGAMLPKGPTKKPPAPPPNDPDTEIRISTGNAPIPPPKYTQHLSGKAPTPPPKDYSRKPPAPLPLQSHKQEEEKAPTPPPKDLYSPTKTGGKPPVPLPRQQSVKEVQSVFEFLFVGLNSSGISSTVATFLNSPPFENEEKSFSIKEIRKVVTIDLRLRLIDVPGFCKGDHTTEDAELVFTLRKLFPTKIPSITFITTRFDDQRFEGEGSDFSKMLSSLSHCQEGWTDVKYSNVLLVLTHASNEETHLTEEEKLKKVSRFQETFHLAFPKRTEADKSVDYILIDNFTNPGESWGKLVRKIVKRNVKIPKEVLDQKLSPSDISLTPVEEYLPGHMGEIQTLFQEINSGPLTLTKPRGEFDTRLEFYEEKSNVSPSKMSCFYQDVEILLADGTTKKLVSKLNVGDKLFGFLGSNNLFRPFVVTNLCKLTNEGEGASIRFAVEKGTTEDERNCFLKYNATARKGYKKEGLKMEEFFAPEKSEFYQIELNYGDGDCVFCANGYLVFSRVE